MTLIKSGQSAKTFPLPPFLPFCFPVFHPTFNSWSCPVLHPKLSKSRKRRARKLSEALLLAQLPYVNRSQYSIKSQPSAIVHPSLPYSTISTKSLLPQLGSLTIELPSMALPPPSSVSRVIFCLPSTAP